METFKKYVTKLRYSPKLSRQEMRGKWLGMSHHGTKKNAAEYCSCAAQAG